MSVAAKNTSWSGVADWYSEHISSSDTYHEKVLAPNLLRIVNPNGKKILDIGCGEGYFTRLFAQFGGDVTGSDISKELIKIAREKSKKQSVQGVSSGAYFVAPANNQNFCRSGSIDCVTAVLTLQNMQNLSDVMKECARVLKKDGSFVCVINHPVLRIPKRTHWGFDEIQKTQYRRMDSYMTSEKIPIQMHPGKNTQVTYSFHRPLQEYVKAFANAGFCITKMEEWISHKTSEKGKRADAENRARKEFPLFLCLEGKLANK